jgi:hypothetical protein
MCFNFKTSITAWFITFILCAYMLMEPKDYGFWIPLFILTFTQIQILEAIIWSDLKSSLINSFDPIAHSSFSPLLDLNTDINNQATKIILVMLLVQPLFNSLLGYVTTKNRTLMYYTIIFSAVLLYQVIILKDDKFFSTIGVNGHLVWRRYHNGIELSQFLGSNLMNFLYVFGLIIPFLYMRNKLKYIIISIIVFTCFATYYNYNSEFSSMWCFYAMVTSLITIVFVELKKLINK